MLFTGGFFLGKNYETEDRAMEYTAIATPSPIALGKQQLVETIIHQKIDNHHGGSRCGDEGSSQHQGKLLLVKCLLHEVK